MPPSPITLYTPACLHSIADGLAIDNVTLSAHLCTDFWTKIVDDLAKNLNMVDVNFKGPGPLLFV
jgi:hypothetical protein